MAKIERYCAPGVVDPPTYSQGAKVTGFQTILFLAGQVAYDPKGQPVHRGDIAAQARDAFRAIKAQVEAGGGTMASKGPASTLVAVAALAHPDWLIEVEAIAVV